MAFVRALKLDAAGFPTQHDPAADELELFSLKINSGGTGIDMTSTKIQNLASGTVANDAVNKGQLDAAVIAGGSVKELLLSPNQLDSTDGIYAAMAAYITSNPTAGQLFQLTDGTTTRQYGADSGGDVQFTIGGTAADTMQNLANAITGDGSGAWDAAFVPDDLDEIDSGGVIVIWENTTAAGNSTSRAFGNLANTQVVEFASGGTPDTDYSSNANAALPGSDPAEGRFGIRRQQTAVIDGEIHSVREDNNLYSWDDTANQWNTLTGPTSIPDATSASGGGVKGKVTFDSDKGLTVVGGVAEVNLEADGAIVFDGTNGGLEVNLEASNPSLQIASNELGVKLDPARAITKNASGIGVNVDGTTIVITGNQLVAAGGLVDTYTLTSGAGGVTKGDPIYVSSNNTGDPCDNANNNTRKYVGVAAETVGAATSFKVQQEGVVTGVTIAGGPAAGDIVWLDTTSGLTVTLPTGSGTHRLVVGKVKNTTGPDLIIEPQYMGQL